MKTKPELNLDESVDIGPNSFWQQSLDGTLRILQGVFLPHLAAGLGMFLVCVYTGYEVWLAPVSWPPFLAVAGWILLLAGYGVFCLGYAFLCAAVCTLYQACSAWEDFIDRSLEKVQEKALSKLDGLDESLAKDQAKVLIRGSVREVFDNVRRQELRAWPRWLAVVCLGGLTLAMRFVLLKRIVKWSGTTIKLSKIFAGKATLIGAIFLNLRFLALLLLAATYGFGGIFMLGHLFLWWLVK